MNGGAVPSSEADTRVFSFDIVPSSQIDNLLIVKTQSPEYPSDYSGGFIVLNTKEIPSENSFSLSLGGNWNTQSAFQDFTYAKGSNTDFLGFDGGLRSLNGGIHSQLKTLSDQAISLLDNRLNNDWHEKTKKPLASSPLLNAASFTGLKGFKTVSYIGAFAANDNWADGWTEFDPENANY